MAYTIQQGDTLSQIAATNKTDIPTIQKLNPQITNPNLIYAGQSLNLPTVQTPALNAPITPESIQQGINKLTADIGIFKSQQPTPTTPIAADTLGTNQQNAIQLPTPSSSLGTSASAMVAGIQERLKAEEALKTAEQKAGEDKVSKMIADIESRMGEMEGKGAYAAEQYKAAGATPEAKAAITSVKSKIAAKTAEFNAIEADYMRAVQATEKVPGTTTGIVAGQQRELARDLAYQRTAQAAQIGILQAEQLALTGAYNDAIEVANNAVELKYGSIKENIALRLQQIELIQGQLNAKEKKVTDATTAWLKEEADKVERQEANEKEERSAIISIMKDYTDAGWTEIPTTLAEATAKVQKNSAIYKKELAKGSGGGTPENKALAYDAIKQRAIKLFADGATKEEYQQMRQEVADAGLGSYLDDFDKFAQPYLPAEPVSLEKVKSSIINTLTPQKDTYTRAEAKTMAENQLMTALGLKTGQVLPEAYKTVIEEALTEVYGASKPWYQFW